MAKSEVSEHAKALAVLGASKGGLARAEKLTPEQRAESARNAAVARWASRVPEATHGSPDHPLKIGELEIPCYVLDGGMRVLTQTGIVAALGMKRGGAMKGRGDRIANFAAGKGISPYIDNDLRAAIETPLRFKAGGTLAYGYEATMLAELCEAILQARDNNALQPQQKHIAIRCEILMRAFAKVGIIALIDEATGYQYDRERLALAEILEQFISKELVKWARMFPNEFYSEIFRLKNKPRNSLTNRRPQWFGKITLNLVYQRLAPGVLKELQRLTPRDSKGRLKHKLFQRLTEDVGHPKLKEHFIKLLTLMNASQEWDEFMTLANRSLPKHKALPLFDNLEDSED